MARFKINLRGDAFRNVLGFTFAHWRNQPWRIVMIAAAIMTATLADILTPLFAGQLVNAVAGTPGPAAWDSALSAFIILLLLGLGLVLFRLIAYKGVIDLTLKMMTQIVGDAFHRVLRFSTDWHANSFAGSTVRKVTRGMWGLDLLNDTLLVALLPSFVMLVGSTILLSTLWPLMGLIVGLGSLIYVVITVFLTVAWVSPAASLSNAWDTKLGGALADAVSCNAVVKGFGAETREEALLAKVTGKWRKRTLRTWHRYVLNGSSQQIMLLLMRAAVLGAGLFLWTQGVASAGDITLVITNFFVLQGYLQDVGHHVRNLQRAVNDMEELVNIHAQKLGVEDKPDATPLRIKTGAIDFEDVTFLYGNHTVPLYEDFSVSIPAGQRVGLVGHSGSGKTTFVKLIQRLYDLNQGVIRIDGQDISTATQASLRQQIAIVQQEPILFHRSLAENIAYARPTASRAEIMEAARQASAHDFIMALPKGYETLVGERGVKLSGGERQRVAIARAFLADAPILIFDEATSSLDSESEVLIQQAMERLMQGRTTLIVAHRLSTVRALDRLLVFEAGRIIEEGTHEQLIRRDSGIYRRLFERQALELTKGLVLVAE